MAGNTHPASERRQPLPTRRRLVLAAAASLGPWTSARAEPPVGWVEPRETCPELALTDALGQRLNLRQTLLGRTTAVQLMFTGCTSTCTTQGALFAGMAPRLANSPSPVAWLSISIDALGDDAPRLAAWLQRMGPHRAWSAAVPSVRDVDALARFLRGGQPRPGTHSNQVFVFDRQARLAYRTGDDPPPDFLQSLLARMS